MPNIHGNNNDLGYIKKSEIKILKVKISLYYFLTDKDLVDLYFLQTSTQKGIARSNHSSTLNFLKTLCTVFHNGYTSLHSHQWCMKVLFSLHPHIF